MGTFGNSFGGSSGEQGLILKPVITSASDVNFAENGTGAAYTITTLPFLCVYSIISGGDSSKFTINALTGVINFITPPDYETPTDANADNVYTITVRATKLNSHTDKVVNITVTDVAVELPVITNIFVSAITGTGFTIGATINPKGAETTVTIEYGTTIAYGSTQSTVTGSPVNATGAISADLTGLLEITRYYFRIKAVNSVGTTYSERQYSATSNTLGFWTNQLGTNVNVVLNYLNISAGKTVHVDWGDSTSNDYTGNNTNITKTYATLNNFLIKLSGDIDSITRLQHESQSRSFGDISNWPLSSMTSLATLSIKSNPNITGNTDLWTLPNSCSLVVLDVMTGLVGNPFKNGTPTALTRFQSPSAQLRGDLSTLNVSSSFTFLDESDNNFSKFPIGDYKNIATFNFSGNNCTQATLDAFLLWLDNSFTPSNKPNANAVYTLNGYGMATPTGGTNNANLLSIVSKYVANSKTCSILVNTFTVAYADHSSKVQVPLTTYIGGNNEVCHPSVLNIGYAWKGYQYWMANTPMPQDNENPSIWASSDGLNWVVPTGITNPIIPKPAGATNFNADPELFFENNTLYLIYMTSDSSTNKIKLTSTTDLTTWTTPVVLIDEFSDAQGDVRPGSPSIIKLNNTYYIYYLSMNVGNYHIRRRSCATINGSYSNAEDIVLTKIATRGWWHLSVKLIGSTIWFAGNATIGDNQNTWGPFIMLAKSSDGINFTRDVDTLPTMCVTETWEYLQKLYRPSLMYIGSQLYMYYSYKTSDDLWATARVNVYLL